MKRKRGGAQEAPLTDAALNVLILGDGNLSYSLALAQRLPNAKVLATSYDDSEEVRAKYADTSAIVTRLLALGSRVRVRHGVDALAIRETLTAAAAVAHEGDGEEGEAEAAEGAAAAPFDHIIFNHPHTGWEDMHRHAALLAHFLESCKAVLEPTRGQVHVTLAGEQPVRWRLRETATRLGYSLRHVCDFYRQFGPNPLPSEIKRHQSGKSFRLRGLPSFTFTFALTDAAAASPPSTILWRHTYEDPEALPMVPRMGAEGEEPASGGGTRKGGDPIVEVLKTLKCPECDRRFRGPKDLRKHVHDQHEKRELEDATDSELFCEPCKRTFKDREAFDQHKRAKHSGEFQDLKPDWSQAAAATTKDADDRDSSTAALRFKGLDAEGLAALAASDPPAAAAAELCALCGYHVPKGVDHLADLRPPERPTFRCKGCDRVFHEERALKQHANACAAFLIHRRLEQQQQEQEKEMEKAEN